MPSSNTRAPRDWTGQSSRETSTVTSAGVTSLISRGRTQTSGKVMRKETPSKIKKAEFLFKHLVLVIAIILKFLGHFLSF